MYWILQKCLIILRTSLSILFNWLAERWSKPENAAVVHLEIAREWRYWRGYYSRATGDLGVSNESSGEFVKLETASIDLFLSVKPDIDIFGLPGRSRKQRGWYTVKTWPAPPYSRSHTAAASLGVASARELPPELFQRIIDMVDQEGRHVLSACGQVCRYWAKQCRPIQFKTLYLGSRKDVLDLCALIESPSCLFTPYLEQVDITACTPSERPWIHLLTKVWDRSPLKLRLKGPLPAGWKSMRSIHQAFPRTLPRHCSRHIASLHLEDISIRLFLDLVHLACELPDLVTLRCLRVTWQSLPATFPRQPSIQRNRLRRWEARDCSLSSARAAVFLFRSIYPASAFFSNEDLSSVLALADTLSLNECEEMACDTKCEGDQISLSFALPSVFRSLFFKLHGSPEHLAASHTFRLVAIDITPYALNGSTAPVDWAALDAIITRLTLLQRLVLGFRARGALNRFNSDILALQMQQSTTRGIVKYAMLQGGLWFRAVREADELKGQGWTYLQDVYG